MNRIRQPLSPLPSRQGHSAFTLVEMLVALAVMLLLFTVIMVPIRLAFDSLLSLIHI